MAVNKDIRILVVDDFLPIRKAIVETLKLLQFNNVDDADNGVNALAKLNSDRFDLVILDWVMPEMDGLELLTRMKRSEALKDIPVMMVTAEAEPESIVKAVKAGVSNYLMKPITVKMLNDKINRIFDSAN